MEENSRRRAVEWLRVCFEWPLLDSCSSNNGRHGYRGGKQTCQSRRSQYTSIWGSCQSYDRCWLGCLQRLRLEEVAGGGGGRENDSSTSFDFKSFCFRVYKIDLLSLFFPFVWARTRARGPFWLSVRAGYLRRGVRKFPAWSWTLGGQRLNKSNCFAVGSQKPAVCPQTCWKWLQYPAGIPFPF